jgi:anti-repressor protein
MDAQPTSRRDSSGYSFGFLSFIKVESAAYNKFKLLTNPAARDYSFTATKKNVAGFGLLSWGGDKPQAVSSAAFLLSGIALNGRAGQGAARLAGAPPVVQPVQFRPPRLDSWQRFVQRTGAHIMTNTPLVPVFTGTISNQSIQLCNARDLYQFLEVGKDFSTWIKNRIEQYGFIEGEDYSPILGNRSDGKSGKRRIEYHLTLDMAKELAMVENNDKGRQIRRYFISLERKSTQALPSSKPKRYHYPRNFLEQPYFKSATSSANLSISMLSNTEKFISPLFCLLNELRADGHEISAPWDEAIAMREAIVRANETLKDIYLKAIRETNMPSKVALKGKR